MSKRPILLDGKAVRCINHGCYNNAQWTGKKFRTTCTACHKAAHGAGPLPANVKPFKTGKCCNQDGRLGYKCPQDYEKAPWSIGYTEMDHIDGDDSNNTEENVQELCRPCHQRKGTEHGDHTKSRSQVKTQVPFKPITDLFDFNE